MVVSRLSSAASDDEEANLLRWLFCCEVLFGVVLLWIESGCVWLVLTEAG